jgi:hypothetical protein
MRGFDNRSVFPLLHLVLMSSGEAAARVSLLSAALYLTVVGLQTLFLFGRVHVILDGRLLSETCGI